MRVYWRLNDILVGVITGAVCSVLAAVVEAWIAYLRIFSVGHLGGGIGSKLPIIAIAGAILGGLIGLFLGAIVKPRAASR